MMEVGLVRSKENCMEVDFVPKSGSESCRCSELEERSRSSEAKCLELERRNELLRKRVEELEKENLGFVNELKVLKRGNGELNQQAGETTEEGVYLEKDEDEDDIFWKKIKCNEGISCYSITEATGDFHAPGSRTGTPYIGTPCIVGEDGQLGSCCQLKLGKVRKRLAYRDGKCSKKLAKSTPGVARLASSINLCFDSDDKPELACRKMHPENGKWKTDSLLEETRESETEIKDVTCQNSNDIEDSLEDCAPSSLTPRRRRRRVRKIVTSESESENGVARPASSIMNMFYSDDEPELACSKMHPEKVKWRTDSLLDETRESETEIKDVTCQNSNDIEDSLEDCAPSSLTPRRRRRRVRKIVTSESESENSVARPASSIMNMFYSDDEPELACSKMHPEKVKWRTDSLLEETRESEIEIKDGTCQNSNDLDDSLQDCAPSSLTPRRRRRQVPKIVTSESESESSVARPVSSIMNIFYSDDEPELACSKMHPEKVKWRTDSLLEETRESEIEIKDGTCQNSNDIEDSLQDCAPSSLSPRRRRRRVRKIVTSESESENGVARPASSIMNIFYSDDEPELACRKMHPEKVKWRTDSLLEETRESETEIKDVTCQNSNDVEDSLEDCAPSNLTSRRGRRRVRKIVTSESESENGVARPASSIISSIFYSDDEPELACKKMHPENGKWRTDSLLVETRESETEIKDVTCQNSNDVEDSLEDCAPSGLTPRPGRRERKIVTSESESENDDASSKVHDNPVDPTHDDFVPESELFNSHIQKEGSDDASSKLHDNPVDPTLRDSEKSCNSSRIRKRRRLVRIGEIQGNSTSPNDPSNYCRGILDTEELEDDSEEGFSENDDTSMDGFIVEDCLSEEDVQDGDSGSGRVDASEDSGAKTDNSLQNVSEDDETYPEIVNRFKRKKFDESELKFEADMLAAFNESPELCMRAVCALYRKQTADEQASKDSIHQNGQGFSQLDAKRGSTLAEFLLDGDPGNDLQKTVEELEAKYHGKGVKLCRELARHYSKQLFDIYNKKEDPYFYNPVITFNAYSPASESPAAYFGFEKMMGQSMFHMHYPL